MTRFDVLRRPLAIIVCVYVGRLVLALLVVPPWQHGDEPQHVASVLTIAQGGGADADARVERAIIESMRRYRFWDYYSRPLPEPMPERFQPIQSVERRAIEVSNAYYATAAYLVRWFAPSDVTGQLHFLRGLSALLGILTLACCWRAARACLPEASALVATAILALQPQFALVSVTATPDMVLNLCGAVIWWQAVRLFRRPRSATSWLALWTAALIATVVRTRGVLLLPVAAAVSLIVLAQMSRGRRRARLLALPLVLAGIAVAIVWIWVPAVPETVIAVTARIVNGDPIQPRTWRFAAAFTGALFDSAWLVAGWSMFPAPRWSLVAMHALTLVAAVGALRAFRENPALRPVLLVALAFVGALLGAIYIYHLGLMNGSALGRYLFPAAGPMSVLLWLGVRSWWPRRHWTAVALGLVASIAAFDAIGWTAVLLPAYVGQ